MKMNETVYNKIAGIPLYNQGRRAAILVDMLGCKKSEALRLIKIYRPLPKIKTPEAIRIEAKLQKIAEAMPNTGHSMGSIQTVSLAGKYSARCDRTADYAKSCTWRPTHGAITLRITPAEYSRLEIIGGIITIIGGGTKSPRIKKCRQIERRGEKNNAKLVWVEGFIIPGLAYHAPTYEQCLNRLNFEASGKKRKSAGRTDSIKSGNCIIGTDAFISKYGLDPAKKYKKSFLLELANTHERYFIDRIFN